jgi:hypothetical protein
MAEYSYDPDPLWRRLMRGNVDTSLPAPTTQFGAPPGGSFPVAPGGGSVVPPFLIDAPGGTGGPPPPPPGVTTPQPIGGGAGVGFDTYADAAGDAGQIAAEAERGFDFLGRPIEGAAGTSRTGDLTAGMKWVPGRGWERAGKAAAGLFGGIGGSLLGAGAGLTIDAQRDRNLEVKNEIRGLFGLTTKEEQDKAKNIDNIPEMMRDIRGELVAQYGINEDQADFVIRNATGSTAGADAAADAYNARTDPLNVIGNRANIGGMTMGASMAGLGQPGTPMNLGGTYGRPNPDPRIDWTGGYDRAIVVPADERNAQLNAEIDAAMRSYTSMGAGVPDTFDIPEAAWEADPAGSGFGIPTGGPGSAAFYGMDY